ncbi:hypothetical protein [Asanoa iriomotensis]|uniref:Uncharacterized protein n=1 Tax=Asanoa iriomotensis TaxID=234613 RepID=A0ABQ4C8K4_9ACTN|nr:hypothetical protein [Asanoa iriomotensis]GIF59116.1 hypothetical protein Air01nite_52110 [Asanoa iriomotensis]
MTAPVVPADVRAAGARTVELMLEFFEDELDGPPTLGEFLEILNFSTPSGRGLPRSLRLRATVKGGRRYVMNRASRVADLNDAVFVEAAELLVSLVDSRLSNGGQELTGGGLASALLQVVHESGVSFADLPAGEVVALDADKSRTIRAVAGDVVAVPGRNGGYHLGVVIMRSRFGTAIGFLRGTSAVPRLDSSSHRQPRVRPLYTDDRAIADGTWPIVGHDEDLRALFPDQPEIYHAPGQPWSPVDLGEFGSAESPSGTLRPITRQEADEVGLLANGFSQTYPSEHLQELLDKTL